MELTRPCLPQATVRAAQVGVLRIAGLVPTLSLSSLTGRVGHPLMSEDSCTVNTTTAMRRSTALG